MPTGVYPRTEYHRKVRSGWHHTKNARKRISKAHIGHTSYTLGKKIHSEEEKKKRKERMIGNKYSVGKTPWNKGKGKFPKGRDPVKIKNREKKYKLEGRYAVYARNTRARRKLADGSFTVWEWENMKKQYGFRCPACFKIEPQIKLSIDHIIPLSKGGTNFIENIQPLCVSCNVKKHTKTIKYDYYGK